MTFQQIGRVIWSAFRGLLLIFAAVVIFALSFYGWIHSDGNQYTVVPGAIYRSAQPTAESLEKLTFKTGGLRTILNLRGAHPSTPWYDEEKAFADKHGIKLISLPLSAGTVLTIAQVEALEEVMRTAPRPLLVHCKSGSDRTGIACALLRLGRGEALAAAEGELALRYGHFPYLWSRSQAMDDSLALHARRYLPQQSKVALSVTP